MPTFSGLHFLFYKYPMNFQQGLVQPPVDQNLSKRSTVQWDTVTYTNAAGGGSFPNAMDVNTGVFTAPLDGSYQFIAQVQKVSDFLLLSQNSLVSKMIYRESPLSTVSLSTVPSLVRFSNSTKQYGFPGLVRFFSNFVRIFHFFNISRLVYW